LKAAVTETLTTFRSVQTVADVLRDALADITASLRRTTRQAERDIGRAVDISIVLLISRLLQAVQEAVTVIEKGIVRVENSVYATLQSVEKLISRDIRKVSRSIDTGISVAAVYAHESKIKVLYEVSIRYSMILLSP